MVNGRILCAFSPQMYANPSPPPANIFPTPTSFAIYNPSTNSFSTIDGPTGATVNVPAYQNLMLVLPDGSVLYSNFGDQLYTYSPDIAPTPLAAGKPAITSITTNSDGSYHLTGTTLNGISEGASYGDDAQMDSNYPIVRLTAGSNQYYARTFNWSSTGIQTGSTPVSTEFTLPAAILDGGGGTYSLVVVANGISSDPVMFSSPVWVDFTNFIPFFQNGTQNFPYATLGQAVAAVPVGGSIFLKGPRSSSQTFTAPPISKTMTIVAIGGAATVGQ